MSLWKFEQTNFVKNTIFDPLLRRFYEYGIDGLVRENIQNSLDAKNPDIVDPVVVKIKIGELNKKSIPGFGEIEERIRSLKPTNSYTKEAIQEMISQLSILNHKYMSFEDENTRGLSGSHYEEMIEGASVYRAYAYSKGFHFENEDMEQEELRGGSHGVGKIASNSASNFHMMFFSNCDEDNYKTVGGTIELMEHELNGVSYRSSGYFSEEQNEVYFPYLNQGFHEVFCKETRGLKIIIPFLREQFAEESKIIRAVCDSFLLAIIENKLKVEVNDRLIDSTNIEEYINNNMYFEQETEEIKEYFSPLYIKTLNYLLADDIYIYNEYHAFRFKLYFHFDMNIVAGRTGVFRRIGMKIEDHKVKSNYSKPYNAILIPYNNEGDTYLKSLENESHTSLDYKHINKLSLQRSAKRFISDIDRIISKIIEEKLNDEIPESEILNTTDIIYEIENKFKSDLEKRLSLVNIGKKSEKKTIVKVKDTDEPGRSNITHDGKSKSNFKKPKKVKKAFGGREKKEYFEIPRTSVRRVIYREYERLEINLDYEYLKDYKSANLMFSIIDGMGKEYSNEISLHEQYKKITDLSNHFDTLHSTENYIRKIDITSKKVKLLLYLSKNANTTLKYKYYLEV